MKRRLLANIRIGLYAHLPIIVRLFYNRFWKPRNEIEQLISAYSKQTSAFRFLQIGANDGIINDPIIRFIIRDRWHGIRVEPLPVPFGQLKPLHAYHHNIRPMQALVADRSGERMLYRLSFSDKRWATGLATLDRSSLQRQIDNGYVIEQAHRFGDVLPDDRKEWIIGQNLKVVGINQLMEEHFPDGTGPAAD